jgi:hypothetical protein
VLTIVLSALLVQTPATTQPAQAPATGPNAAQTWTGCVQAGSAPSTYRLNIDPPAARTAADAAATPVEGTQGDPFVQLLGGETKLDLTKFVGKRVRITGRELTAAEAEQEAARRPNRQEAAETAGGTGGTTQRHARYVRIQTLSEIRGECR